MVRTIRYAVGTWASRPCAEASARVNARRRMADALRLSVGPDVDLGAFAPGLHPRLVGHELARLGDRLDLGAGPLGHVSCGHHPRRLVRGGSMQPIGRPPLLQGTLDLLILRTLAAGRAHGQGVARAIQAASRDGILVDHGSLYPALQRLEERG